MTRARKNVRADGANVAEALRAVRRDSGLAPKGTGDGIAQAVNVLRTVRESVFATHRRRDAETTMRAVFCYVAYLSGATLDEQVRALEAGSEPETSPGEDAARERRLRNRVYKLRERGRRALGIIG